MLRMPTMADVEKLQFLSPDPIDKIVQQGSITIVNSGNTASQPLTYQEANIVESTVTNEYGRPCLVRASWSIDGGTNYQALEAELAYSFVLTDFSVTLPGLDSAISIGCTSSLITFRTANGRHGNVSGTPPDTYTPTSRTFEILYWLYEIE